MRSMRIKFTTALLAELQLHYHGLSHTHPLAKPNLWVFLTKLLTLEALAHRQLKRFRTKDISDWHCACVLEGKL